MSFNFILTMSAAINPNGMKGVSAQSIVNREEQYLQTLLFYAKQPLIKNILFIENSAWDLQNLKNHLKDYSHKITYLSLNENNYPREWGKGYGEFLLLDKGIDYIKNNFDNHLVLKVTGRFPILNINSMIKEFSKRKNLQLAIDVVDHPFYDWLRLGWASHKARTIIYACSLEFYDKNLYGRYTEIPLKFTGAESLMFNVYLTCKKQKGVYCRFKHEPRLSGSAGAVNHVWLTANNYDGFVAKCKRFVQQFVRYFLPFIKI